MAVRVHEATGLEYLALVTRLLHQVRLADATTGLWEAADFQWWWRTPRRSDEIGQTFWMDGSEPVAAVILTDWGRAWGCDPIVGEAATPQLPEVWSRALARIDSLSLDVVEVAARDDNTAAVELLGATGFLPTEKAGAETWMLPADRPAVPTPPHGYRLLDRTQTRRRHHFTKRNGDGVADRLAQCSLYRPELDLFVEGPNGDVVSYGLFWFDPVTAVGYVEPMRTEAAYYRQGLARLVLAAGLERLANLGAGRLKVYYEAGNVASQNLYLGAGFRPAATSRLYSRRSA